MVEKFAICVLPLLRIGKIKIPVNGAKRPNGTVWLFSKKDWYESPSSTCAKDQRSILKGNYRPVNGKTNRDKTNTARKLFCRVMAEH